jgi:hypothetical protein
MGTRRQSIFRRLRDGCTERLTGTVLCWATAVSCVKMEIGKQDGDEEAPCPATCRVFVVVAVVCTTICSARVS